MKAVAGASVDIWTRLPSSLGGALNSLRWAADCGFSGLVAVGEPGERRVQLLEGARALGLNLTLRFRGAADLTGASVGSCPCIWADNLVFGTVPSSRDLKRTARILGRVARSGLVPVVVGPELNAEVGRQPELLRYILQAGACCCARAGSLVGQYGNGVRWTASRIAWMGYYSFVGGYVQNGVRPDEVAAGVRRPSYIWRTTQGDWLAKSMVRARELVRRMDSEECAK